MPYRKLTMVFPGQGSQYVGMGKDLHDRFDLARRIFQEASEILGYDMAEKCFKAPTLGKFIHRSDLDKTIYTQPAVMVASYACYRVFEEFCRECGVRLQPSFLAGHSLGEYTALLVAGAFDFRTAVRLVQKRATLITEFSDHYPDAGLMAVVDKDSELELQGMADACRDFQVYMSLNNTRKQVVVGGFKKNLSELSKKLKKDGKLATVLRVEGPFHTPLMKPAAERFSETLGKTVIYIASTPVIANASSEAIVDPAHVRKELFHQIFTSVEWRSSVEKAIANGADLFIEVGPKKVLTNMLKDIDSAIPCLNVENLESLERTVKELAAAEVSADDKALLIPGQAGQPPAIMGTRNTSASSGTGVSGKWGRVTLRPPMRTTA